MINKAHKKNQEIVSTKDGSSTIYISTIDEHYHSINGAIDESEHVFMRAGYDHCNATTLNIMEVGFGTGLNALLTAMRSKKDGKMTRYLAIEKYPVDKSLVMRLNYSSLLGNDAGEMFQRLHNAEWNTTVEINELFMITKVNADFLHYHISSNANIIYFDAFAPSKQPEMWNHDVLAKAVSALIAGGIFVTYSAKGTIRRSLTALGLEVERLPGAAGKREMIRAVRPATHKI